MTLAYDGRGFHGFAAQPGLQTVAGSLAAEVARVLRLEQVPAITCAGRTDAGVHAWGQSIHLDVPVVPVVSALSALSAVSASDRASDPAGGLDLADLHRRLVKLLAPRIVVREVSVAPPEWDARHSALARSYRYTVLNRPLPDPFLHGRVWLVEAPLDRRALDLACDPLIGEHDFSSFCRKAPPLLPGGPGLRWLPVGKGVADGVPGAAAGPGGPIGERGSLVRRVLDARWVEVGDGLLRFDIRATSFCQQMVRALVGTLVDVGLGRRRAGEMTSVLRARDRAAAGPIAPPDGLCLWEVEYPPSA
jgi:tRNA pseudouridine38-40 synthase